MITGQIDTCIRGSCNKVVAHFTPYFAFFFAVQSTLYSESSEN